MWSARTTWVSEVKREFNVAATKLKQGTGWMTTCLFSMPGGL